MVKVQVFLATLGAVLLVLFGAYRAGGRATQKSIELERRAHERKLNEKAREVEQEVDSLPDSAVHDRARKWVRPQASAHQ